MAAPEGTGAAARVRVQRLDANGHVVTGWPADGAIAAKPSLAPSEVRVIADGTGGASVAWVEQRGDPGSPVSGEVRLSRVLANGRIARGFASGGAVAGGGRQPSLVSGSALVADGTGGTYLAWPDAFWFGGGVYVQHLTGDGRIFPGWQPGGLALYSEYAVKNSVDAVPDGSGGVYVAWDLCLDPSRLRKVRLLRLAPDGGSGEPAPAPALALARIAPNPVSGLFTLDATLPDDRPARLEVFDVAGRVSQVREVRGAGEQGLTLDGSELATGVHWMRLTHPTGVRLARIVVVR